MNVYASISIIDNPSGSGTVLYSRSRYFSAPERSPQSAIDKARDWVANELAENSLVIVQTYLDFIDKWGYGSLSMQHVRITIYPNNV